MKEEYRKLIVYLLGLEDGSETPVYTKGGICNVIQSVFNIHKEEIGLEEIFKSWEHWSGITEFPISDPYKWNRKPDKVYMRTENLWVGKYGKLRRELCGHVANELKNK